MTALPPLSPQQKRSFKHGEPEALACPVDQRRDGLRPDRQEPRSRQPVQTIDFENRSNATSFCRTLVEEKGRENVAFMIIDLRPTKTPTNKPAAPIQISMIDLGRWPIRVRLGK